MKQLRQCWLWRDEGRLGPFTPEQLWQFAAQGALDGSEMVIEAGLSPLPIEAWFSQESLAQEGLAAQQVHATEEPQSVTSHQFPGHQFPGHQFPRQGREDFLVYHEGEPAQRIYQAGHGVSQLPAAVEQGHSPSLMEPAVKPTVKPARVNKEVLLWEGYRSSRTHLWLWAVIWLSALPAALQLLGWVEIEPLWWLLGVFCSLLLLAGLVLAQGKLVYRVSSERILLKKGRFLSSTQEMHLGDVRSISCLREGVYRWLGLGTLEFRSGADGGLVRFEHLANPRKVERMVRRAQRSLQRVKDRS